MPAVVAKSRDVADEPRCAKCPGSATSLESTFACKLEHGVPHFRAAYEGRTVSIGIRPLTNPAGGIPQRALGMGLEWAAQQQDELQGAADEVMAGREPQQIPGLR